MEFLKRERIKAIKEHFTDGRLELVNADALEYMIEAPDESSNVFIGGMQDDYIIKQKNFENIKNPYSFLLMYRIGKIVPMNKYVLTGNSALTASIDGMPITLFDFGFGKHDLEGKVADHGGKHLYKKVI